MIPKNRDDFTTYCLRKLGYPVIDINVAEDQVEDRIDEALHFYQLYHYEALERTILMYQITQEDIDNDYITLPYEISSVTKLATGLGNMFSDNFMSNIWQGMKNLMYDIGFGLGGCTYNTSNYAIMMQYLAHIEWMFSVKNELIFNHVTHRLQIPGGKIGEKIVGDVVALECYRIVDPDAYETLWETPVLVEYATALIGCQWGSNLSKFDQVTLPGGITLDGDKLYDRYEAIKNKIEEDFQLKWEEPVDFFVG